MVKNFKDFWYNYFIKWIPCKVLSINTQQVMCESSVSFLYNTQPVTVLLSDNEKYNVLGGSIAIGHPFGMTGSRQTGLILRELKRRNQKYGVVTMCIGGGQGAAGLFEVA